jgi:hypothetical protein
MVENWPVSWSDFSDFKSYIRKAYSKTYKFCGVVLMKLPWQQQNVYVPKWTNEKVTYTTQNFSKKRVNKYIPLSFCNLVLTTNLSLHLFLGRCLPNWFMEGYSKWPSHMTIYEKYGVKAMLEKVVQLDLNHDPDSLHPSRYVCIYVYLYCY